MIKEIIVGVLLVTTFAKADTCRNVTKTSTREAALKLYAFCAPDEYLSSPLPCKDVLDWAEFKQEFVGSRGVRCINSYVTQSDINDGWSCGSDDAQVDLSCLTPITVSFKCCK